MTLTQRETFMILLLHAIDKHPKNADAIATANLLSKQLSCNDITTKEAIEMLTDVSNLLADIIEIGKHKITELKNKLVKTKL